MIKKRNVEIDEALHHYLLDLAEIADFIENHTTKTQMKYDIDPIDEKTLLEWRDVIDKVTNGLGATNVL